MCLNTEAVPQGAHAHNKGKSPQQKPVHHNERVAPLTTAREKALAETEVPAQPKINKNYK